MVIYIQTEHMTRQTEGVYEMNKEHNRTPEETAKEMIEILKNMPQDRQAYLNGYAAGMNAERKLSAQQKPA